VEDQIQLRTCLTMPWLGQVQ